MLRPVAPSNSPSSVPIPRPGASLTWSDNRRHQDHQFDKRCSSQIRSALASPLRHTCPTFIPQDQAFEPDIVKQPAYMLSASDAASFRPAASATPTFGATDPHPAAPAELPGSSVKASPRSFQFYPGKIKKSTVSKMCSLDLLDDVISWPDRLASQESLAPSVAARCAEQQRHRACQSPGRAHH